MERVRPYIGPARKMQGKRLNPVGIAVAEPGRRCTDGRFPKGSPGHARPTAGGMIEQGLAVICAMPDRKVAPAHLEAMAGQDVLLAEAIRQAGLRSTNSEKLQPFAPPVSRLAGLMDSVLVLVTCLKLGRLL